MIVVKSCNVVLCFKRPFHHDGDLNNSKMLVLIFFESLLIVLKEIELKLS